jgi:anti-anti-sigma factor
MGAFAGGRRLWRLKTSTVVENGTTVLILEGRLGQGTAGELMAAAGPLVAGGALDLVIDLSRVDYLSSAALKVLESLAAGQTSRGGRLTLRAPSPAAQLSLELSGDELVQKKGH